MKKILALLLAVLMLSLTMVACSSDDEGTTGDLGNTNSEDEVKNYQPTENPYEDNFEYDYVGKDIKITGFSGSAEKHAVTIPAKIGEITVAEIAEGAFDNCSNISEVVIPEGIRVIDDNAFTGCAELTKVTVPTTLESIGIAAFSKCSKLATIDGLRDSAVIAIGDYAFFGCAALTAVELPEGLTTINTATFADCTALTTVRIGEEVTTIGMQAFYGCTALDLVALPASVTELGLGAFGNCKTETMETLKASISEDMTYPEGVTIDHVFITVEEN